jgi:hypothetical protein
MEKIAIVNQVNTGRSNHVEVNFISCFVNFSLILFQSPGLNQPVFVFHFTFPVTFFTYKQLQKL